MASNYSRNQSRLSAEELEIFREATRNVRRMARPDRVADRASRPEPHPYLSQADEAEVVNQLLDSPGDIPEMDSGEALEYRSDGIQKIVLRRLRRGHYRVGGELDLHGLIVVEARSAVRAFLKDARDRGRSCVRIIHGKGLRSRQKGPVLKMHLNKWLRQHGDVLAFCSARPIDGGTGAVYVLLRR